MSTNSPQSSRHTSEYISLRDYFEALLAERDKAIKVALYAQDKRLDGMNEFRATIDDQGKKYLTKAEFDAFRGAIDADIRSLRESRALLEGKASQVSVDSLARSAGIARSMALIGTIIGVLGLILSILSWLF